MRTATKISAMKVPFVNLSVQYQSLKEEMDAAIFEVINESSFIGGRHVDRFEKEFARLYGVKNCVSCANGTDSLYILLRMMGIGDGDEVITVANSWISTSETIVQAGAKPIFIDIEPGYFTIDPEKVEEKINAKTKALMPVHLYGQACNMDRIMEISRKYNIPVIEDCAQSHFSAYGNKLVGLFGIAGSFSFYPGKNLGAYGDAGCIITNDDGLAEKCRMFARHGCLIKHQHQMDGINSRLDGLQAAILSVKLPHLAQWNQQRIEKAALYDRLLASNSNLILPLVRKNTTHTFHLYVIRAKEREKLQQYLKKEGIETSIHYPRPLPFLEPYKYQNNTTDQFPVSSQYQHEILSLPLFPEITAEEVGYVCEKVNAFYGQVNM